MDPLKIIFLLNMGIFHCYVSLPEGTPFAVRDSLHKSTVHINVDSQATLQDGVECFISVGFSGTPKDMGPLYGKWAPCNLPSPEFPEDMGSGIVWVQLTISRGPNVLGGPGKSPLIILLHVIHGWSNMCLHENHTKSNQSM